MHMQFDYFAADISTIYRQVSVTWLYKVIPRPYLSKPTVNEHINLKLTSFYLGITKISLSSNYGVHF